jgi:hypothetical protein
MDAKWMVEVVAPVPREVKPAWIGPGFALPSRFQLLASKEELNATVEVRIVDGRAVVTKLSISSGDAGVTTTELRSIPLREFVALGARMLLLHAEPGQKLVAGGKHDEESLAAIRKAVGFVGVPR